MSIYRIDGRVLNTDKAAEHWDEATFWDGNNHISKASGSQWNHQALYRSRKGRYYVERTSQWQGSVDSAEIISSAEAAAWLLLNGHALPEELAEMEAELVE